MNLINPFSDSGIATYEQFKKYSFLIFGTTLEVIKNRISQQINEINQGYFSSERLILLAERGLGKTSALFFINDMLKDAKIKVFYFTRLIEDITQIHSRLREEITKEGYDLELTEKMLSKRLNNLFTEPTYILIDYPDSIDTPSFKKHFAFLWEMITDKNYDKINLVFSMNKSHYEKSFSYSEILGKFISLKLERLDFDETCELINSRLKMREKQIDDIFLNGVTNLIYTYSKGIPRNIISACSLLVSNSNGNKVSMNMAGKILQEEYINQVINDRVEDLELKRVYKQMISILKNEFNGAAKTKKDYVQKVMSDIGIGMNSVINRIKDLTRFGVITEFRGGYNRINKIIAFREEDIL